MIFKFYFLNKEQNLITTVVATTTIAPLIGSVPILATYAMFVRARAITAARFCLSDWAVDCDCAKKQIIIS